MGTMANVCHQCTHQFPVRQVFREDERKLSLVDDFLHLDLPGQMLYGPADVLWLEMVGIYEIQYLPDIDRRFIR